MEKERIPYIDVAKGLLILMVLLHHMPHVVRILGVTDSFYQGVDDCAFLYSTYFMPAFFLITGYCSRQTRELNVRNLVIKNLKTIILPAFTLGLVCSCIGLAGMVYKQGVGVLPIEFAKAVYHNVGSIVKNGGNYWFLSALFVAKIMHSIIYHNVIKISIGGGEKIILFAIYLTLVALGYLMFSLNVKEHWAIWHAFLLCIFLYCGQLLRESGISKRISVVSITTFVVIILFYVVILNSIALPRVAMKIVIDTWYEVPVFLILSFTGSVMIFTISRFIYENRYLQYWGRNSLTLYCLHVAILFKLYKIVLPYIGFNVIIFHNDLYRRLFCNPIDYLYIQQNTKLAILEI